MFKKNENTIIIGPREKSLLIRVVKSQIMVRVGGGWENFNNYINKFDECRRTRNTNIPASSIEEDSYEAQKMRENNWMRGEDILRKEEQIQFCTDRELMEEKGWTPEPKPTVQNNSEEDPAKGGKQEISRGFHNS